MIKLQMAISVDLQQTTSASIIKVAVIGGYHNQGYLRAGVIGVKYLEDSKDYEIIPNNSGITSSRGNLRLFLHRRLVDGLQSVIGDPAP